MKNNKCPQTDKDEYPARRKRRKKEKIKIIKEKKSKFLSIFIPFHSFFPLFSIFLLPPNRTEVRVAPSPCRHHEELTVAASTLVRPPTPPSIFDLAPAR
jgi:hypothetical protein